MYDNITFTPIAQAKMMTHAARHSRTIVNGILIGKFEADKVLISDIAPVCHSIPTKPLLDMALRLTEAYCVSDDGDSNQYEIVGWYTAPEKQVDNGPGPVALKIIRSMAATVGGGASTNDSNKEPVLVTITNSCLEKFYNSDKTSNSDQMGFLVHGKDDETNHWTKQYEEGNITMSKEASWKSSNDVAVEVSLNDGLEFYDFEDHVSGGMENVKDRDWLRNGNIAKTVSKLLAQ